jgi:N-acetylglucosamine transport system substrate-binding protein
MPYGDGKTYLMPMFYSPRGFFYNIELFAKNRWTVPATWENMWLFAENAKSNGMYLFTYPKAEYLESFLYALMYSVGGADFFNGVMTGQEGVWDTKEARNFVKILGKLASYTHPDTASNANDASYKNNQLMIMFDETLFMPNGKEVSNDMQVEEQSHYRPFGWGMSAFPAAVEGGCGYTYCTVEQLWIPADAVKKTEAEQFVAFMYSDNAAKIFATKGAVQPIKGISSIVDSSAKIFYSLHDNGAKAALGGGSLDPVYIESFNQLVDGTINTNQYLANVKEAGDRMRAELAG